MINIWNRSLCRLCQVKLTLCVKAWLRPPPMRSEDVVVDAITADVFDICSSRAGTLSMSFWMMLLSLAFGFGLDFGFPMLAFRSPFRSPFTAFVILGSSVMGSSSSLVFIFISTSTVSSFGCGSTCWPGDASFDSLSSLTAFFGSFSSRSASSSPLIVSGFSILISFVVVSATATFSISTASAASALRVSSPFSALIAVAKMGCWSSLVVSGSWGRRRLRAAVRRAARPSVLFLGRWKKSDSSLDMPRLGRDCFQGWSRCQGEDCIELLSSETAMKRNINARYT